MHHTGLFHGAEHHHGAHKADPDPTPEIVYNQAQTNPRRVTVLNAKTLDDLARRLADSLPPGLHELQQDAEKNLRAALESAMSRLELVSREEFEVQRAVLARTREKLETLEKQVAELEKQGE